jgi:hypothetical protein
MHHNMETLGCASNPEQELARQLALIELKLSKLVHERS